MTYLGHARNHWRYRWGALTRDHMGEALIIIALAGWAVQLVRS